MSQFLIGDFYDIAAGQHLHPNLIVGGEVALVEGELTDRGTALRRGRVGDRRDDIAIDWACDRRRCSAHESEHYDRKYRNVTLLVNFRHAAVTQAPSELNAQLPPRKLATVPVNMGSQRERAALPQTKPGTK